ncbi:nucleoside hydrolase [Microbacterium sp. ISL-59]|uniref:nucleoside hydrolase n=1 Tax=Microbacterium sp. ISL-59 TaxID=2819159 RepID=UPI001BE8D6EE|nr:nucleoside hydrolase [Microbacterium sp. ISL-59]MBT2495516.1 nucleoside hydrolase [Microbacterium sp. ISL-59]
MTDRGYRPTPILIETDLCDDVDDAGAIAVAHALADRGLVEILGIGINTSGHWSHSAARVLNDYYGRAEIPVGIRHPITDEIGPEDYARAISRMHPHAATPDVMPDAVAVLREALAGADDGTVTVVSIGYFGNLVALLDTPADALSALSGRELVAAKVARAVVMGGVFGTRARPDLGAEPLAETNFAHEPGHTARFLAEWPSPVDFVGWETAADVITGRTLSATQGDDSPVAIAYSLHSGKGIGRPSWDLLAVMLAAGELDGRVAWSGPGTVSLDEAAGTLWAPSASGRHRYAVTVVGPEDLSGLIDDHLGRPPLAGAWGAIRQETELDAWR